MIQDRVSSPGISITVQSNPMVLVHLEHYLIGIHESLQDEGPGRT